MISAAHIFGFPTPKSYPTCGALEREDLSPDYTRPDLIRNRSPMDVRLITHVASSAARKEEMVLAAGGEQPLIHYSSGSFVTPLLQSGKRLKVVYVTSGTQQHP